MNMKKEEEQGVKGTKSGNGMVPPGFRFHPTDEELIDFYLRKKVTTHMFELDHVIPEVDLNKLEPWDLCEKCKVDSSHQTEWYFFSHKDKKYPTGTRTNRATKAGFWKATGRDKAVLSSFLPAPPSHGAHPHHHLLHNPPHLPAQRIGMRKTLVFYQGRAPHGLKTDWIMHEYRLQDAAAATDSHPCSPPTSKAQPTIEDGWVVCRVFKKKNYEEKSSTKNYEAKSSTSASSYYDHTNLSDEEHGQYTKSSHIVTKLPEVRSSQSMSFSTSGRSFPTKKPVQDSGISLATPTKPGVNHLPLFSCKQELMGLSNTTSYIQPLTPTFFQLNHLENSEILSSNSFLSSLSTVSPNPSIHTVPPSMSANDKRVAAGHVYPNSRHVVSHCINGNLEEISTSTSSHTRKDFFLNEEELAPPCADNVGSTQQYWSLYDIARLQGADQAYPATTHLGNDELFPHINGVHHHGKVGPSMENYSLGFETDQLWSYPR